MPFSTGPHTFNDFSSEIKQVCTLKKKTFGRECSNKACMGKVPTDWIGYEENHRGEGVGSKTVIERGSSKKPLCYLICWLARIN